MNIEEEIKNKLNETIAYAVGGECGGKNVEDCKTELLILITKAMLEGYRGRRRK